VYPCLLDGGEGLSSFSFCCCSSFFQTLFNSRHCLIAIYATPDALNHNRPADETMLQASYFGPKESLLFESDSEEVIVVRLLQSCLPFFEGFWISFSALLSLIGVGVLLSD